MLVVGFRQVLLLTLLSIVFVSAAVDDPDRHQRAAPGSSPDSSPESSPVSSPDSSPESSPDSSPESSPVASPDSSPESSPASSPESSPAAPPPPAPPASAPGSAAGPSQGERNIPENRESTIVDAIKQEITLTTVPSSGRAIHFAVYNLKGSAAANSTKLVKFFDLYIGTEDTCAGITLCTTKVASMKIAAGQICDTGYDIVTFVAATKSVYVKSGATETRSNYYTRTALFARDHQAANYQLMVHDAPDDEFGKFLNAKPVSVNIGEYIAVIGSSRNCPLTVMQPGDSFSPFAAMNQAEKMAPVRVEVNEKALLLPIKGLGTSTFARDDKYCQDFFTVGFEPKLFKATNAQSVVYQRYKLAARTNTANKDGTHTATTLEIHENPCGWVRLCFETGADQSKHCADPKRVLDILVRHGAYIPTDTEEAYTFSIATYGLMSKFTLRFYTKKLEFGHGPISTSKFLSSAVSHTMNLDFDPKAADSYIYVVSPASCAARLKNPKPSIGGELSDISIVGCDSVLVA